MASVVPEFGRLVGICTGGDRGVFGVADPTKSSPCNLLWAVFATYFTPDAFPGIPQLEAMTFTIYRTPCYQTIALRIHSNKLGCFNPFLHQI